MRSSSVALSAEQVQWVVDCAGRPARISFFTSDSSQVVRRVHGLIDEIDICKTIDVASHGEVGQLLLESPTIVEVMIAGELTILHTTLQAKYGPYHIALSWPSAVRTQQRRQHPRVDIEVPMHYLAEGSYITRYGVISNLSAGGLAFTTRDAVDVGAELSLAFGLGSGCFLNSIQGRVVRCIALDRGGYQVGAQFIDLHPTTFQQLRAWVEKRLSLHEPLYRNAFDQSTR